MARPLAKSPLVLFALGFWILTCPASFAKDDDPNALNQQVTQLYQVLLTKDHQFLAQTYNVQYVTSGRDLLRELKPSTDKQVALFANPDFGLASTAMLPKAEDGSSHGISNSLRGSEKRVIEDWRFESLAGTQKESDELIKRFAGWDWTHSLLVLRENRDEDPDCRQPKQDREG
jgi:hypothetical protein